MNTRFIFSCFLLLTISQSFGVYARTNLTKNGLCHAKQQRKMPRSKKKTLTAQQHVSNKDQTPNNYEHDAQLIDAIYQADAKAASQALHKGANPNTMDYLGNTVLHLTALRNQLEITNLLLESKLIDVNRKNNDGDTPLYVAIIFERYAVAKALLGHKNIDANCTDSQGQTPLHLAALKGDPHAVTLLLQHTATNIDAIDQQGNTPLHVAARNDEPFVAQLLVQRGAKKNIKNKWGHTPQDLTHDAAMINTLS